MGVALTGGEALFGQGFQALLCMDVSQGHPGVRKTGTFHPSENTLRLRYGGINIFDPIEYLPENNAGAHASGLNSQAPALLPLVFEKMGITIAPNLQRDALDLSLLVGATQWVIQKAIEFKLLEVAAPPVVPPNPPVVVPPVQPPTVSGLHPWSPAERRVHELRIELASALALAGVAQSAQKLLRDTPFLLLEPFAVEALRFYRLVRKSRGDLREIPQEDR